MGIRKKKLEKHEVWDHDLTKELTKRNFYPRKHRFTSQNTGFNPLMCFACCLFVALLVLVWFCW